MKKVLTVLFWVLFCVGWIPYAFFYAVAPHYTFPPPSPFRGERLHNPYASLSSTWYRANFHAHGRAWLGLTAGVDQDADIVSAYRNHHYEVAGVSNYMQLSLASDVPVYEHGYNLSLSHQLVIGAKAVSWIDMPKPSLRQKQFVLNRINGEGTVVALAHPSLAEGYSEQELTSLQGYQAMEVANHSRTFPEAWDAALSSGHRVWALGNDDTHDIANAAHTFRAFTLVNAPSTQPNDVVRAISQGRTIAVRQNDSSITLHNSLKDLTVFGLSYTMTMTEPFTSAQCIGDRGQKLSAVTNAQSIRCELGPSDSYARVEVTTGGETLFFNPLSRELVNVPPIEIAWLPTFATALALAVLSLLLAFGARYVLRSKTTK